MRFRRLARLLVAPLKPRVRTITRTVAALAVAGGMIGFARADVLLSWNTAGNTGTETTEPAVFFDPNLSTASLTFGAGVTPASNGNRFGGSNWFDTGDTNPTTLAESITGNDYIQFVVTPNSGVTFSLTTLVFTWERSGTGPTALTIRSSVDGFATDLGSLTGLSQTQTPGNTLTISGITDLAAATTFRLYGYGGTATGGTGGFDTSTGNSTPNVVLNGTTTLAGGGNTVLYWRGDDTTRGGTGTWDQGVTPSWSSTNDEAGVNVVWDSTKTASFGGASATGNAVTVSGAVSANNGIAFTQDGYTLTGGNLSLGGATAAINTISTTTGTATIVTPLTVSTDLTKNGLGTLILAGANTINGGITVNAGRLELNAANAISGTVTVGAGSTLRVATEASLGAATGVAVNGGTFETAANVTRTVTTSGSAAFAPAAGTTLTVSNDFTAAGTVTVAGTGTLSLQGTVRTVGSLAFTAAGTLAGAGEVAATNLTATGLTAGTASVTTDLNLGTGTKTVAVGAGGTLRLAGNVVLAGSGNTFLDKTGAGTLRLEGANPNLFRVRVTAGVVEVTNNTALGTGGAAAPFQTFFNGGTVRATTDLTGANRITTGLSIGARDATPAVLDGSPIEFNGPVALFEAASAVTRLNVNTTAILSGPVTLTGTAGTGFTVGGTGTLVVAGDASGQTRATTLQGTATLLVTSTYGAAVTAPAGTTLSGGGTVTGAVTVGGGTIRGGYGTTPGVTPSAPTGTLTAAGGVTLGTATAAGTLAVDFGGGTTVDPGTGSTPTSKLALTTTGTAGDLNFVTNGGTTPVVIRLLDDALLTPGSPFQATLATVPDGLTNFKLDGNGVTGYALGTDFVLSSAAFPSFDVVSLVVSGNDLVLTATPAPEPATVLGLAAAGLGLGGFVRRRFQGPATPVAV